MKLIGYKVIRGRMVLKSGLRIGTSKDMMAIGDVDNPVIRNPLTGEPYVPGSSLKGKMRYLLEWHLGGEYITGSDTHHVFKSPDPKDPVNRIFGSAPGNNREELKVSRQRGPTRLLVRDAYLTESSRKKLYDQTLSRGSLYTEVKQEVFIPRTGGNAKPRTAERVPAGAEFGLEVVYRVFDLGDGGKTDSDHFHHVLTALRLVELDGLGGYISRGYGQVAFQIESNGSYLGLEEIGPEDIPLLSLAEQ